MKLTQKEHAEVIAHGREMLADHADKVGLSATEPETMLVDLLVYLLHTCKVDGMDMARAMRHAEVEFCQDEITTPAPDTWACRWFALCENPAVKTKAHPILGTVPICQHCADKVERIEAATKRN